MGKSRVGARLGLTLGLESEDGEEMNDLDIRSGDETVEAEMLEVEEVAGEVEEHEEAVEELEDAAEGLESIAAIIAESLEDGGLSPREAAFMQASVESYTGRLGVASPVVASLESFGGSHDKLASTQASLEGLKDFLAEIWRKIVQMINKLRVKLSDFWLKTFDAAPRLAKRAEAIKKAAADTTGAAEEKTVKGPLKALHIGGKATDPTKALQLVLDEAAPGKGDSATTIGSIEEFGKHLKKVAANPKKVEEVDEAVAKDVDGYASDTDKRFDGRKVSMSNKLPGGKEFYSSVPTAGTGIDRLMNTRSGMVETDSKLTVDGTGDFSTMKTGDVQKACDLAIKICNQITDYKRDWDKRKKAIDDLKKEGDKLAKSNVDDLSTEQQGLIKKFVSAVGAVAKPSFDGSAEAASYSLATVRAALVVCDKSLKQYK